MKTSRRPKRARRIRANPSHESESLSIEQAIALQKSAGTNFWREIQKARKRDALFVPTDSRIEAILERIDSYAAACGAYHASEAYRHAAQMLGYTKLIFSDGYDIPVSAAPESAVSYEELRRTGHELREDLRRILEKYRKSYAESTSIPLEHIPLEDFDF